MPAYVYIFCSEKIPKFYVGHTENLDIRLGQHNSGRNIATKAGIPWTLEYTEIFPTKAEAAIRKTEIKKKKSRKYIEQLICSVD